MKKIIFFTIIFVGLLAGISVWIIVGENHKTDVLKTDSIEEVNLEEFLLWEVEHTDNEVEWNEAVIF